jgi:hypothetical protein
VHRGEPRGRARHQDGVRRRSKTPSPAPMARRCHQAREAARSWRGGLTRPLALLASLLSAAPAAAQAPLPFGVWWHAPFFSGGGYR